MAYIIHFKTHEAFKKGYKYLLSKGFMFTTSRIKHYREAHFEDNFTYIFVGHYPDRSYGCKMIMNTSYKSDWIGTRTEGTVWNHITLPKFVREVLPTW